MSPVAQWLANMGTVSCFGCPEGIPFASPLPEAPFERAYLKCLAICVVQRLMATSKFKKKICTALLRHAVKLNKQRQLKLEVNIMFLSL